MNRASYVTVLAAVLLPWCAAGKDQPKAADPAERSPVAKDVQDLVFLGDTRPVLIRLHVCIDGKPLQQCWDDFINGLFQYLDRDGNGVLSQEELGRAPRPQFLLQLLRGNLSEMRAPGGRPMPEVSVSLVGDKVTRAGLAGYYRLSGVEPFLALFEDRTTRADALTEALFKHLDLNGDGKLSKDELLAAATSLRALDLNDDELISIQELLPDPDSTEGAKPAQRQMAKPLSNSTPFILLSADDSPTRLARILLGRYDKDQNQKLSRTEIGLDKQTFEQMDLNHDGELDADELAHFLARQPIDIELIVRLGNTPADGGSIDVYDPFAPELGSVTPRTEHKPLAVRLGDGRIDLHVTAGLPAGFASVRQFMLDQFEAADADKRGFLDKRQIQANPYLLALFPLPESEREWKLSREELAAYVDLLGKAVTSSALLTITDQGRALFELLNTHHDGRLRQRELKAAWARLAPWDKDGDGQISRAEIPRQLQLRLSQGQAAQSLQLAESVVVPLSVAEGKAPAGGRGPVWFRKMDRNGDGEVSLREWLGSKEEFQRIDTNGDGVISLEEAERADAQFRTARNAEENSTQKRQGAKTSSSDNNE